MTLGKFGIEPNPDLKANSTKRSETLAVVKCGQPSAMAGMPEDTRCP